MRFDDQSGLARRLSFGGVMLLERRNTPRSKLPGYRVQQSAFAALAAFGKSTADLRSKCTAVYHDHQLERIVYNVVTDRSTLSQQCTLDRDHKSRLRAMISIRSCRLQGRDQQNESHSYRNELVSVPCEVCVRLVYLLSTGSSYPTPPRFCPQFQRTTAECTTASISIIPSNRKSPEHQRRLPTSAGVKAFWGHTKHVR